MFFQSVHSAVPWLSNQQEGEGGSRPELAHAHHPQRTPALSQLCELLQTFHQKILLHYQPIKQLVLKGKPKSSVLDSGDHQSNPSL